MGNKSTRRNHSQPDCAYPTGTISGTSGVQTISSGEEGCSDSEPDCIDIQLIRVDSTVQSKTKLGEAAWIKIHEVNVRFGRLGDIPHSLRVYVENQNYKRGSIVNIEVPTVRFCTGK